MRRTRPHGFPCYQSVLLDLASAGMTTRCQVLPGPTERLRPAIVGTLARRATALADNEVPSETRARVTTRTQPGTAPHEPRPGPLTWFFPTTPRPPPTVPQGHTDATRAAVCPADYGRRRLSPRAAIDAVAANTRYPRGVPTTRQVSNIARSVRTINSWIDIAATTKNRNPRPPLMPARPPGGHYRVILSWVSLHPVLCPFSVM